MAKSLPGVEPAEFLVENASLLPRGRLLDVAMGSGRNAVYLATLGYRVEGIDISAEAVAEALASAQRAGVVLKTRVADLERDARVSEAYYDGIIVINYLQRSLIAQLKAGLRPGGVIIYETFTVDQAQFGRPTNPDFLLRHNELLDLFRDFRVSSLPRGYLSRPTRHRQPRSPEIRVGLSLAGPLLKWLWPACCLKSHSHCFSRFA